MLCECLCLFVCLRFSLCRHVAVTYLISIHRQEMNHSGAVLTNTCVYIFVSCFLLLVSFSFISCFSMYVCLHVCMTRDMYDSKAMCSRKVL